MTEKPEFPKPRLIREDFLSEPMNKYRIKKLTYGDVIRYYPQEKFLFWWHNTVEPSFDGGYSTLEQAQEALRSRIKEPEPVIEYIDFDPERDCK